MTASQSASSILTSMRSRRMPALLTSTSSLPKAETACSISRRAPSQWLISSRIGDGLATGGVDLGDDGLRRRVIGAAPGAAGADIADDDLCALGGELQRVFASNAARRPG